VWGHVSRRDPDGRGAWIKGGPRGFDEVSDADVVFIDFDGRRLSGPIDTPPREYPLHTEILRSRGDVMSVVHVHPPHAIALAATGAPLQVFSNAECLGQARAVFLVGHGIVTVGASVAVAVMTALLLERACRLQLLAAAGGGIAPALEQPGRRYEHTESDAYMLRSWEHLLRRVQSRQ